MMSWLPSNPLSIVRSAKINEKIAARALLRCGV